MTLYFVANDNALVYHKPGMLKDIYAVLAGDVVRGGPNPMQSLVCASPEDVRLATLADFDRFRVSPKYHLRDREEVEDEGPCF